MPLTKRRLRRERAAMLRHLAMMRVLILLTEFRFTEQGEVKKELGITELEGREQLFKLRTLLRDKYIPGSTKARMLFDEWQEIDMYVTGPFELHFCLAQAMVDQYQKLISEDPVMHHPELDRFLVSNSRTLDAVADLRDWVLHPGIQRQTDKAVSRLWDEKSNPAGDHPIRVSAKLFQLFEEFVENLDELIQRD